MPRVGHRQSGSDEPGPPLLAPPTTAPRKFAPGMALPLTEAALGLVHEGRS
jgi:hypothetical protein